MAILEVMGIGISFGGHKGRRRRKLLRQSGADLSTSGRTCRKDHALQRCLRCLRSAAGASPLRGGRYRVCADRLAALSLSRTFQNLQIFQRMTSVENVMVGRHLRETATCLLTFQAQVGDATEPGDVRRPSSCSTTSAARQRGRIGARSPTERSAWKLLVRWRPSRVSFFSRAGGRLQCRRDRGNRSAYT